MPRTLLARVEATRQTRLLQVNRSSRRLKIQDAPPTSACGLYWLYTRYSQQELEAQVGIPCANAVNIGLLAQLHKGLANVCALEHDGFKVVYNGIAGNGCGLRKRLHQHFNGGEGTGSLAILRTRLNDLTKWRISYVTMEVRMPALPDISAAYGGKAKLLERIWRLQYGWPLLCTN